MFDVKALDQISGNPEISELSKAKLTAIQRALAALGYPISAVDGLFGPNTRGAFAECVVDHGPGRPEIVTEEICAHLTERVGVLNDILAASAASKAQVTLRLQEIFDFIGLGAKDQIAYAIATATWETAHTLEPVKEAYWLSEAWRRSNLRYYPYYGRGYVQLTWKRNYETYGKILGIDLDKSPDEALRHDVALFVIAHGMKLGTFTGRKLEDYVRPGHVDFIGARRVINGIDKAAEIAALAESLMDDL